jgi:hypothetical protein
MKTAALTRRSVIRNDFRDLESMLSHERDKDIFDKGNTRTRNVATPAFGREFLLEINGNYFHPDNFVWADSPPICGHDARIKRRAWNGIYTGGRMMKSTLRARPVEPVVLDLSLNGRLLIEPATCKIVRGTAARSVRG